MLLSIKVDLEYSCEQPSSFLLQIEAASNEQQAIIDSSLEIIPDQEILPSHADERIGERVWLRADKRFQCKYEVKVDVSRVAFDLEPMKQHPFAEIRGDVTKYLMPSRYCHLEKFENSIPKNISHLSGGRLVIALCRWMEEEFNYVTGASTVLTTAHDTLNAKKGVCRDYAQVLIAMLRVSGLPARMVSAYAPNVEPQDFHALVEVYLDGNWHLVDPTGMSTPEEVAIIGVGRDAADISFLTAYGFLTMINQSVCVNKMEKAKI